MARAQSRRLRHARRRAPQRRSIHRRQPASRPRHTYLSPRQIRRRRRQAWPVHSRSLLGCPQLSNLRASLARRTHASHAPRWPLHRFRRSLRVGSSPGIRLMPAAVLSESRSGDFTSPSSLSLPSVTVKIGGIPILLQPSDPKFCAVLESRYESFATRNAPNTTADANVASRFEIHLDPRGRASDEDARVTREGSVWHFRRGDFDATWNPQTREGRILQCPNPYSIDTVLRITHSLVLAEEGGFLLHAASAIRNNRAFLFAGVSGAGKTTISRLAPADATLLTDEISYVRKSDVRRNGEGYTAFGTPFTGELAKLGENVSAPIAALYLLAQGGENRIDRVAPAEAARALLANVLFFAKDEELVQCIFHSAFEFVSRVPVSRLTFVPDVRVWELIG